jgi:hypothetical protein
MRNKYTTIFKQTVPRCIKTIGEQGKIYTPNTSMHDLSISWHFNKNNGGVMLLLLAQVFPLIENDDKPHSPGVLQFIFKFTEVLLYVVFYLPVNVLHNIL